MKWRRFVLFVVLLLVVAFALWGTSPGNAQQPSVPEIPPEPSNFDDPKPWPTTPALERELNEREVLEKVFEFDSQGVEWEKPWSIDKLDEDPERITVSLYDNRVEADKSIGLDIEYSPDLVADAGKVWVITITGTANASKMMMHMPEDELVSGVTYFISARTGELIGMNTWPKLEN